MISNTDSAWASIEKIRSQSNILALLSGMFFIVGIILIVVNIGDLLNPSWNSNASLATTLLSVGILLASAGIALFTGWVFSNTMANHSEVVYFSSPSNKSRYNQKAIEDFKKTLDS